MTQQYDAPEGNCAVRISYLNWRGEHTQPLIAPRRIFWGSNEWHPKPCWLIEAFDVEKGAVRTYDLAKIGGTPPAPSGLVDAVRPKILEAADIPSSHNLGDWALTCEWPDGRETLEHVSDQAARLLGFVAENEGDGRDDATLSGQQGGAVPAGDERSSLPPVEQWGNPLTRPTGKQIVDDALRQFDARLAEQPAPAGTGADGVEGLRKAAQAILNDFQPPRYAPNSDQLLGGGLEQVPRRKLFALRAALDAGPSKEGRSDAQN